MDEIITFTDVSLGYHKKSILDDLCFSISSGDFLGIVGTNGSGKTTILKGMLGLLRPLQGQIATKADLNFGYVIQRQQLDTIYPISLWDIVMMGRYGRMGILGRAKDGDRSKVRQAMELTGIYELKNKHCSELSGGQLQRLLIARAIASEPDVMLLDEPTNDMDIKGEEQIMQLLKQIHSELGITIIMVSHLLHVVLNYVNKIIFLNN